MAVAVAALFSSLLCACAQTSKVNDAITPAALTSSNKAVALMRIGAASPTCINVAVLLGTRDGDGFRRGQVITVANVRSLAEQPVAEVELEAGEHHVIGYGCAAEGGKANMVMDKAGPQIYRTSYAHFAVKSGEVVNVGYLNFGASHIGRSTFGRPLRIEVSVTDWPLREAEQFKLKRPGLFAQMTTRLMHVTDRGPAAHSDDECQRLKAMHAAGKMQTLPVSCLAAAPAVTAGKKPKSS
jgi:hypothetical protein